jgi:hypothetical protein
MTPKEKAQELFNQFANVIYDKALTVMQYEICKQCALIAVDELYQQECLEFWQEVKQEIEAL